MSAKNRLTMLLVLCLLMPAAAAQSGNGAAMKFDSEVDVHANGDAALHLEMKLSPAAYSKLKTRVPNPFNFLRDFTSNRADSEIAEGAGCRYDDATTSFVMDLTELGAARNLGGGSWELPISRGPEFVMKGRGEDGRTALHFYEAKQEDDGSMLQGKQVYRLPKGAEDAAWDERRRVISYRLAATEGQGAGRLEIDLKAKARLMTCVYKTYGLGQTSGDPDELSAQWVAKAVIRNTGGNTITGLRIRYRVAGYSEWSPWQKFQEVVPAQTAVSVYYPVLERKIAEIRTNTPANVLAEWKYVDGEGREREDGDGRRVTLLGVNEFVFSNLLTGNSSGSFHDAFNNAPLLAAWVSRNDPVVKQFAAMANRIAGGVGASSSVDDALKALKGCYDLLLRNDFTYQHPPALTDKSVSFEPARVQNVKFPRDVIRDRSGTCIDLAILYASMANAIGLEACLCVVPGHVFPVVRLPNGVYAAVETTGVGGGRRGKAYPFETCFKVGMEKLETARSSGRYHLVDCQRLWTRGVSNPELAALPPDILRKWGIVEDAPGAAAAAAPPPQPAPSAPAPAPRPAGERPRRQAPALSGLWGGKVTEQLESGATVTFVVGVKIAPAGNGQYKIGVVATGKVPTSGGLVAVTLAEVFQARFVNGALVGRGVKKTITNGATGKTENVGPLDVLRITRNGNGLMARMGNDEEGYDDIGLAFIER